MNDLTIGLEQSQAFEKFCKENPTLANTGKVEFSVQMLTTGHWPQYKPLSELQLPAVMARCTQAFKEYYDQKTSHRKLTWTYSLGSATIKGNFNNFKKSYEMQVTTVQAIVLLAFNNDMLGAGPLSFQQLADALQMSDDILKKVLHSLVSGKFKVLKKAASSSSASAGEDAAASKSSAIRVTDSFAFNDAFT